jgi:aspartyl-tRNA(Asn)/glutamyl-tRNA(Gln) amidotransferase subunit C
MTTITTADVKKLSELARINLSDQELEQFSKELGSILHYVEQLNEVTVPEISVKKPEHIAHRNVMREDSPRPDDSPLVTAKQAHGEALVDAAPDHQGGFVKVKKILSQD